MKQIVIPKENYVTEGGKEISTEPIVKESRSDVQGLADQSKADLNKASGRSTFVGDILLDSKGNFPTNLQQSILGKEIAPLVETFTKMTYDGLPDIKDETGRVIEKVISRDQYKNDMITEASVLLQQEFRPDELGINKRTGEPQTIDDFLSNRLGLRVQSLPKRLGLSNQLVEVETDLDVDVDEEVLTKPIKLKEAFSDRVYYDKSDKKYTQSEMLNIAENAGVKTYGEGAENRINKFLEKEGIKERFEGPWMDLSSKIKKKGSVLDLSTKKFKDLKGLVTPEVQELFGVKPKTGNLTKGDISNAQQFIRKNTPVLKKMLPEGTTPSGTSTGVQKVLLDPFYTKKQRVKTAKTGSQAGLPIQKKRGKISDEEFQAAFGITPVGEPSLYKKATNVSARIRALIDQTERMLVNQSIREDLDAKGFGESIIKNLSEGKSRAMFSESNTQNLNKGYDGLNKERKQLFIDDLPQFISAIDAGQSPDKAWVTAYGKGFLDNKKGEPLGAKKIMLKEFNKVVNSAQQTAIIDLNTGKPRAIDLQEYVHEAFAEQTDREVAQNIIGISSDGLNFRSKDQLEDYVNSLNAIIENKSNEFNNDALVSEAVGRITENEGHDYKLTSEEIEVLAAEILDEKLISYAINNLAPTLTAGAKVGGNDFMWKNEGTNIDPIWSLVQSTVDQSKRIRTSIFPNQITLVDVLVKPHLNNPELISEKDGSIYYNDNKVLEPRVAQKVNNYVTEFLKTGALSPETLNSSAEYAAKNRDTFIDILDFYKHNPDKMSKNAVGMFMMGSGGDMTAMLRASAPVNSFAKGESTNPNDYRYEHNPPVRVMMIEASKYINGDITKQELLDKFDNYNVTVIPKVMDGIINLRYNDSIPLEGWDNVWKRYFNDFTYGAFPYTVTEFVETSDGKYDEVEHGKFQPKAYKTVQKAKVKNSLTTNSSGVVKFSESNLNEEIVKETIVMDKALAISRDPNAPIKKIRVFDFDDTLAQTKSKVFYTMPDGTKGELTAENFAKEGTNLQEQGAKFDFSDFDKVVKGKKGPLFKVAETISDKRGTQDMFVLTARGPNAAPAIKQFLDGVGLDIPVNNIVGLGDSSPFSKSEWIVDKASEGYNDFYFADDHTANVNAVKNVLDVIDVKSKVQQAKVKFSETINEKFNFIIENKTGIEAHKVFARTKGIVEGKRKRGWSLIPPSAEDFVGLLYKTLGKGKLGDAQMDFYKETLLQPYSRAMNDLSAYQNRLVADFKAVKNQLVESGGIPKNLNKKAVDNFTYQDVSRILAWDKQGITVDGLSKVDLAKMKKFASENPEVDMFAEQLININKDNGYAYPGSEWLAGTITTDLIHGLNTDVRSKFLTEWQTNIDQMFSEANLNKLEAAFGNNYREALENMLERMRTGKNRKRGASRIENQLLDYINNSVGAVMFLNMRSAALQTISAINFINWDFNNPLNAGIAFANQPQYWKDFMTLMNSDFLVDRRNGLRINVSESEIADAAATSKNKAKSAVNYLLKKGFLPTQFADSFAIASGGATWYRNKINKLLKENPDMDIKEVEKIAFDEFREIAEESQQSSRPDRISQQQASNIGRVILAFANTPSQYARIMKKAALDLANGRGDWRTNVSKIVYYGAVQNIIFNALQQAIFAWAWDGEDDDDKTLDIANGMLDSLLRGCGWGGAMIAALKNVGIDAYQRLTDENPSYKGIELWKSALKILDFSPPIDIKISKLIRAGNEWEYNKWKPEASNPFSLKNPAYSSLALVVAATTNIPVDRLFQKTKNVGDAVKVDQENWKRVALMLGWPEWQLESKEQRKIRREEDKELKKNLKAINKISVYNKDEQEDILKQYGVSQNQIDKLKNEGDRIEAIKKLRKKTGVMHTPSKEVKKLLKKKKIEAKKKEREKEKLKPKTKEKVKEILETKTFITPKTFDKSNKKTRNKIKIKDRTKQQGRLYKLNKSDQIDTLKSLGLSNSQIDKLRYEEDRVRKIEELYEENK